MSLKTSIIPEYFPRGAVCNRDFSVSGAMATTQFITPALPPATIILPGLNSSRLQNMSLQVNHDFPPYNNNTFFLVEWGSAAETHRWQSILLMQEHLYEHNIMQLCSCTLAQLNFTSQKSSSRASVDASDSSLTIQLSSTIQRPFVLCLILALHLYLITFYNLLYILDRS